MLLQEKYLHNLPYRSFLVIYDFDKHIRVTGEVYDGADERFFGYKGNQRYSFRPDEVTFVHYPKRGYVPEGWSLLVVPFKSFSSIKEITSELLISDYFIHLNETSVKLEAFKTNESYTNYIIFKNIIDKMMFEAFLISKEVYAESSVIATG
jgi:hypothetical protein